MLDLAATPVKGHPLNAIGLRFALNTFDVSRVSQLDAWSGASIIGSATATAAILTSAGFPEGFLAFNSGGTTFDRVRLTATAQDFAIDDIDVPAGVPEPVPEPGSGGRLMPHGPAALAVDLGLSPFAGAQSPDHQAPPCTRTGAARPGLRRRSGRE